jgi:large subunit ribosomal protein L17
MRHRVAGRKLSRDSEHRLAMQRNLVASLFEHERVSTTMEKAKEVRKFAERLITLAKKGDLAARRRAISLLGNRDITAYEEGEPVRKGTIVGKLFSEIAPRYLDRPGGYTRIVKLAMNRLGDNGQVVLLQLVGEEEGGEEQTKKSSNKRARRAAAYAESVEKVESEAAKTKKEKAVVEKESTEEQQAESGEEEAEEVEEPAQEEENKEQ